MSAYEQVVSSLSGTKTIASHITSLGKIKTKTEDDRLIVAIEVAIAQLQSVHARTKVKSTPICLERATAPEITDLLHYSSSKIKTKKPEWQILAERNGWSPNNT